MTYWENEAKCCFEAQKRELQGKRTETLVTQIPCLGSHLEQSHSQWTSEISGQRQPKGSSNKNSALMAWPPWSRVPLPCFELLRDQTQSEEAPASQRWASAPAQIAVLHSPSSSACKAVIKHKSSLQLGETSVRHINKARNAASGKKQNKTKSLSAHSAVRANKTWLNTQDCKCALKWTNFQ